MLDPALQQHNAVRDELRWACSLRNDPLNVSVCGLLYVDMSSNRISDEGAAAFAQYLFHDNWLQGEKRLHRGAACSLARRGVSHIHARTHTCCCAALNLQNNELGEEMQRVMEKMVSFKLLQSSFDLFGRHFTGHVSAVVEGNILLKVGASCGGRKLFVVQQGHRS